MHADGLINLALLYVRTGYFFFYAFRIERIGWRALLGDCPDGTKKTEVLDQVRSDQVTTYVP